jgi:hypothetical protein
MATISKAQLIRLQKKLKTDQKIADQFGITRQAVHQLRQKYGIESVRAKNDERNKKIISSFKSGDTGRAIAKKFGLSVTHVYKIVYDANVMRRKKTKTAKKAAKKKAVKKTKK